MQQWRNKTRRNPQTPPSETAEKTDWLGIPHVEWFKVVASIIILLAGEIVAHVYKVYNSKEPHLSYRVNESVTFKSDKISSA